MNKRNNIILIGLLGFGLFYFYRKSKNKLIAKDFSNKENEEQEEATESGGVGGGFGVPNLGAGIVKDGVVSPSGDVINITVENKDEKPKLEAKPFDTSKLGSNTKSDGATLLANLETYNQKVNAPLPTNTMGMGKNVSSKRNPPLKSRAKVGLNDLVDAKRTTVSLKNVKEIGDIPIKTMSNFYDFDGDEIDNEQFLID